MKTLAELKRQANSGKLKLGLVERYGETNDNIPQRLRGIRKVKKANSIGLILENLDGKESKLRIERAKLMDYDGKTLIIYEPGEREPNEQEQRVLNEWRKIQEEWIKQNPYNDTYWKKVSYFKNSDYPYLSGFDECKGKLYQYNGMIRDKSIKGEAILKYKVYMD